MFRYLSRVHVVLLALLVVPAPARSQALAELPAPEAVPVALPASARCAARGAPPGPRWRRVLRASTLPGDEAGAVLAPLQDSLMQAVETHPDDVDLRYLLAVVLGARAETASGRDKIRIAGNLHAQLQVVLDLDPDHAGAEYLLGRLHAAVMRMSRVSRFVATRLLGGGTLAGATWDEAQRLLEAAVAHDPCVPDYHFELARLYAERGDTARAREQLRQTMRLGARSPRDEMVHTRAVVLAERLEG